jgi:hypothetical protein
MEIPTIPPAQAQAICESLLGSIEWKDSFNGFTRCPGLDLHTSRNGARDCKIMLSGPPTLFCLHASCTGVIAETNRWLRSEIGRAERCVSGKPLPKWTPTPQDIARREKHEREEALKARARKALPKILTDFRLEEADLWEESPVRLDGDIRDEWRLQLQLFAPHDVVWIGDVYDSGKPENAANFRFVSDWRGLPTCPGNFTCGSTFHPWIISRSNETVAERKFLIIESDTLKRGEMLSVIAWCRQFMRLRAVVSTGGRSLHAWFNFPEAAKLADLRVILPELGCDPALFKPAQPCRLAGAYRREKSTYQTLLFLDLNQ